MRRFTQFILVSCLLMLCSQTSWADFKNFSVQVNNQAGTLLTAAEQTQGTQFSFGAATTLTISGMGYCPSVAVEKSVLPVIQEDAGKTYTNEPFSVVYAMNDKNNPGTYTSAPADAFSTVAFDYGDATITGVANVTMTDGTDTGKTGIKFKPAGSVADLTGNNIIKEDITITFETKIKPAVTKGTYDAFVSTSEELDAAIVAASKRADQNSRYRIFIKNGKYVGNTTEPSFSINDANATWTVRAANEMGGLSEATKAVIPTGIHEVEKADDSVSPIYNALGQRINANTKGLQISKNGKRIVK